MKNIIYSYVLHFSTTCILRHWFEALRVMALPVTSTFSQPELRTVLFFDFSVLIRKKPNTYRAVPCLIIFSSFIAGPQLIIDRNYFSLIALFIHVHRYFRSLNLTFKCGFLSLEGLERGGEALTATNAILSQRRKVLTTARLWATSREAG